MIVKCVTRWSALFGIAAVVSCVAAAAHADHLKLGNEGDYPPFSMVDSNGKLQGVEPDWAREMCKRMLADCEIVVMDFKALIPSLLEGKIDAVVSQINPLPERKAVALFSIPVVENPFTFVVPISSHYQFTKEGLKGVKLGVQRGSADAVYIQRLFGNSISVAQYDNPDLIRLDLLAKRIDIAFGHKINWTLELINTPAGKDWKLDGGNIWDPSMPPDASRLSWITPKGPKGEELIKRMNVALESMIKDCSFTKIKQKYLQTSVLTAEAPCLKTP